MATKPTLKTAVSHIEDAGILLVYPIHNRKEPESLWTRFYPKTKMRWEWDSDGDDRVASLWILREELSRSRKVVYSKWFQGRATFFSRTVFKALVRMKGQDPLLSRQSQEILQLLQEDSPLSTKEIKAATELKGRSLEPVYNRAMKELWSQFQIVGFGEKDDGAFPSLLAGATSVIFEDLWQEAQELSLLDAERIVYDKIKSAPALLRFLNKKA